VKPINWNSEKNQWLIEERGISFEDVVFYLQRDAILDDIEHPNLDQYPNQRVFVLSIDEYIHLVPYVENDSEIFLTTVIPSRKLTKQYLGESNE